MTVNRIKKRVLPILIRHRILKASLFGSVVSGKLNSRSDIDVLVKMPKSASLLDLAELKDELELKLGRKVDVLTFNSIHPLLKESILNNQKVIL